MPLQQTQGQQGQAMQNAQGVQTPPNVLTSKDISLLRDEMAWLLGAIKKCSHYAGECTDPQVRQMMQQVGQAHQRQYDSLLQHCQMGAQQGSSQPAMQ